MVKGATPAHWQRFSDRAAEHDWPTVDEPETADWRGRTGELVDAVVAAEAELISELGSETEATVIANRKACAFSV